MKNKRVKQMICDVYRAKSGYADYIYKFTYHYFGATQNATTLITRYWRFYGEIAGVFHAPGLVSIKGKVK